MPDPETPQYDEAMARALAYTDATGLSDGTDRPVDLIEHLEMAA